MKVRHKHASPAHFSPWHPKWMNEILGYIKLLRLRQHLLPLRSTLFSFFFFSINWFRKIEIPRKKVRQRWKQTIKSWDSARCRASCASCNRQISLKLFDGNSSFTHSRWISLWKHYRRKSSPKQNVGLEFGRSRPVHIQELRLFSEQKNIQSKQETVFDCQDFSHCWLSTGCVTLATYGAFLHASFSLDERERRGGWENTAEMHVNHVCFICFHAHLFLIFSWDACRVKGFCPLEPTGRISSGLETVVSVLTKRKYWTQKQSSASRCRKTSSSMW